MNRRSRGRWNCGTCSALHSPSMSFPSQSRAVRQSRASKNEFHRVETGLRRLFPQYFMMVSAAMADCPCLHHNARHVPRADLRGLEKISCRSASDASAVATKFKVCAEHR